MPVPSGTASLLDIQNEFGGSAPISLSEYYGSASGVPTSGAISINTFRGKSAFNYSWTGSYGGNGATGQGSYSFGLSFGTAADNRVVVAVGNSSYGQDGVGSVYIGGKLAKLHAQAGGTYSRSFIASAWLPSGYGTSGTVTVNYNGGMTGRVGVTTYVMYGLASSDSYNHYSAQTAANGSYGRTIATQPGRAVFGTVSDADGFAGNWTGLVENIAFSPGHGQVEMASVLASGTSLFINCTSTGSNRGSATYVSF